MLKHNDLTDRRIEQAINNVVRPAVFASIAPLDAAATQSEDPIPYDKAVARRYRRVEPGWRWGPPWSTAWFRFRGQVPRSARGKTVWLRVDVGSEACLWVDGVPRRGLNTDHHRAEIVVPRAKGGEGVELYVEAACNAMFGVGGYGGEEHREDPARFAMADLALRHDEVWALSQDMRVLFDLMRSLPDDDARRGRIRYALNEAVNRILAERLPETAREARAALAGELAQPAAPSAHRVSVIGHSHIDTAWLWPLRETIRKCSRTFSTVLRLMERYPEYQYQQGQAQLYAYVKEQYPELYRQIRRRVREGRWEAAGAMWVEADCNISGGESLVRQILHGQAFFDREFGVRGSYLWLPDVFGYSAAMPQILRECGLTSFITQKISWSQFNKFPHSTFRWEGIDGTRIFTHFLPADNYNGIMTPSELRRGVSKFRETDRLKRWLYVFGWGDGGGGPTEDHLESWRRVRDLEGVPKLEMEPVGTFLDRAHEEARDLPLWVGELYLEYHRGTYTTQARNKKGNRKSEFLLRDAEILTALSPVAPRRDFRAPLDRAWKLVLLNQFHDIIPGSSIAWVYRDSARDYAEVGALGTSVRDEAQRAWASAIDTRGAKQPLVVWNTLSWPRSDLLDLPAEDAGDAGAVRRVGASDDAEDGALPVQRVDDPLRGARALVPLRDMPSLGHAVVDLGGGGDGAAVPGGGVKAGRGYLENELVRVEVDGRGRLTKVYDKVRQRDVVPKGRAANDLVVYEDRPTSDDAWDVDLFYLEKPLPDDRAAKVRIVERGPWRAALFVERPIGERSRLRQKIELRAGSARIDFVTEVDWNERRRFLRALFPVVVHSPRATFEIQYGNLERPTHFNTSWDFARFEVPTQKWFDLSEADYGAAVLNDCKYGCSVHGDVMGLSLLRGTTFPDPEADYGVHTFTYSLFPHAGDYRAGGVVREAYALNAPLLGRRERRHGGALASSWSALGVDDPNVVVEAVKPAEAGGRDRVVVRFYEAWSQRGTAVLRPGFAYDGVEATNLLEESGAAVKVRSRGGRVEIPYHPFAIRTVALGRAGAEG